MGIIIEIEEAIGALFTMSINKEIVCSNLHAKVFGYLLDGYKCLFVFASQHLLDYF